MKITVIAVGKIKEKYFEAAINEYVKRISKYTVINFVEVKECGQILKNIATDDYVVCLAVNGEIVDSIELSGFLNTHMNRGTKRICFIIGGSNGLTNDVLKRADFLLSFSKMTFPHQLMRVILTEQIYRGFSVINNEPYHK